MSQPISDNNNHSQEHGTVHSYIVGLALSLLFTLIPYTLVINQSFTGTKLLLVIVGFAMIQVIIHVTFFLHLGRGPKPNWQMFFFVSTVMASLVVVGGSVFIMNQLYRNMRPLEQVKKIANDENIYQVGDKKTGACLQHGGNHQVVIRNNKVLPQHTSANKCDTLSFINEDDEVRAISFGQYQKHETYAGENSVMLKPGRSKTITLSEHGTHQFHDHFQHETAGVFTVTE